jgi:hypothetical protein
MGAIALILTGCQAQLDLSKTAVATEDSAASPLPAPTPTSTATPTVSCAFSDAVQNGLNASDVARTNYSCRYVGGNARVIHVFLADGTGRLQDPSNGPLENTTWTLDTAACAVTVRVGGAQRYTLSIPTLNGDDTLSTARTFNHNTSVTKDVVECVYDTSAGQTF